MADSSTTYMSVQGDILWRVHFLSVVGWQGRPPGGLQTSAGGAICRHTIPARSRLHSRPYLGSSLGGKTLTLPD